MRKRPRLTGEINDAVDVDADFLPDFAPNAILDRFAGLDETGERAVTSRRKSMRARQQELVVARDERHHRGRHARIRDVTAHRAFLRALALFFVRWRTAASAVAVCAIPFDDLEGAGADGKQGLGHAEKQRA